MAKHKQTAIKDRLRRLNLNQTQLAHALDCTQATVSRMCNGRFPDLDMQTIAKTLRYWKPGTRQPDVAALALAIRSSRPMDWELPLWTMAAKQTPAPLAWLEVELNKIVRSA